MEETLYAFLFTIFSLSLTSTLVAASISPFAHHRWKIFVFLPTKLVSFVFFFSRSTILNKTVEKIVYLGKFFAKHRSCTVSSLSPFLWKQCCCVFKRKPVAWAFVGSNIELGKGDFFPQRRRFGNSFVAPVGKWTWWGKLSQVVLSGIVALSLLSTSRKKESARVREMQNFIPAYMKGWSYILTIFSETMFLGCIDYQIFLPMLLRCARFVRARAPLLE